MYLPSFSFAVPTVWPCRRIVGDSDSHMLHTMHSQSLCFVWLAVAKKADGKCMELGRKSLHLPSLFFALAGCTAGIKARDGRGMVKRPLDLAFLY